MAKKEPQIVRCSTCGGTGWRPYWSKGSKGKLVEHEKSCGPCMGTGMTTR
jgi:DnaJ-class molecular chaperone